MSVDQFFTLETSREVEKMGLRTAAPALTFNRLLLEEVMRHGYNTLCRCDILNHL